MSQSKSDLATLSQHYRPAVSVAPFVSGWGYRALQFVFGLGALAALVGILYSVGSYVYSNSTVSWFASPTSLYVGLFLVTTAAYLTLQLGRWFFMSYYMMGLDSLLYGERVSAGVVYEVAAIIHDAPDDVTAGFLQSQFGRVVLRRVGLTTSAVESFLQNERNRIVATALTPSVSTQVTLTELARLLTVHDQAMQTWLQTQGISIESMLGAASWTHREHVARKRRERWWSRDQLSQKQGIGRDFSYGVAYTLEAYSKSLTTHTIYHDRAQRVSSHPQLVEIVEQQLAQVGAAGNVLLVGAAGVGKLDIVAILAERIASGQALGSIHAPQVRLLDTERLLAEVGEKASFETKLLQLLAEAANAGNVVMVIEDLPEFIASAAAYDVAVDTLLDEYVSKSALRVIATSTPTAYHRDLATNSRLLRYFHIEMVMPPDYKVTLRILEELAFEQERQAGMHITYQALERIATAADRYVVQGVMPDKAIHLFDEIMISLRERESELVTVTDVDTYVRDVTGMPVGPISTQERSTLLNLETVLHERIVGQPAAVTAISSVMRRARADIQASDKPMGSFLFMGPTGVGKTESAKALAAVFFKHEDAMHRFDMSEYSDVDSLARLIGTTTTAGTLATALSEHPYAVVLLDEFEKAAEAVHDVFLQILDEGQFTDGRGKRINARNTIIIATSNAGSEQIMEWLQNGDELSEKQPELIEHVISTGVYKPELINRFDDVVLFAPLQPSEQRQIATQMLEALAKRMQAKGYTLVITDALVDTVTTLGYNTQFGARPMRRAIQTAVEDLIAEKVIAGTLQPGDTVTFTETELAKFIR